jgi:hypothetical protein
MTPTTGPGGERCALSAQALFDAYRASVSLECEFYEQLASQLGAEEAPDDVGYDYYDGSFEMYGCPDSFRLSSNVLTWLWCLGFKRGWLNHYDGTETYYSVGGGDDGTHQKVARPRSNDGVAKAIRVATAELRARALTAEASLRATAAPVGVSDADMVAIREWQAAARHHMGHVEAIEAEPAVQRLLDAHAALVSHGDGVAAQLVEVTHKATRAALVAIVELDGIACGNNAPCVGPVERAIDALLALVPDDGEEEFDAKRSLAALDATRTPVPPPGDTPDGGAR